MFPITDLLFGLIDVMRGISYGSLSISRFVGVVAVGILPLHYNHDLVIITLQVSSF